MKQFNVNDYVYVKLTDKGKEICYHQYDEVNAKAGYELIKPHMPVPNEDGFYKFQMHDLMQIFGNHMYAGCQVPFETTIYFNDKDIKEKEDE